MRKLLSILVLGAALNIVLAAPTAAPAHAGGAAAGAGIAIAAATIAGASCGLGAPACILDALGSIADMMASKALNFLKTFSTMANIKMQEKMTNVQIQSAQALAGVKASTESQLSHQPGANCGGPMAITSTAIAAGAIDGKGDMAGTNPTGTPPVPKSAACSVGGRQCPTKPDGDLGNTTPAAWRDISLQEKMKRSADRLVGDTPEGRGTVAAVNNAQREHDLYNDKAVNGVYSADGKTCVSNCTDGKYGAGANMNPGAIFDNPTFTDKGKLKADDYRTIAEDYCVTAIAPEIAEKVTGSQETAATVMQKLKDKGANARTLLAMQACMGLVAEREAVKFTTAGDAGKQFAWVKDALCAFRRASNLTGAVAATGASASVINSTALTSAQLDAQCNATGGTIDISDYELQRVLNQDIYATPIFATLGKGNEIENTQVLVAMQGMESMMNLRILDLQEKIMMLRAASLAVDVESKRGN